MIFTFNLSMLSPWTIERGNDCKAWHILVMDIGCSIVIGRANYLGWILERLSHFFNNQLGT
jgi:hypothetical protein